MKKEIEEVIRKYLSGFEHENAVPNITSPAADIMAEELAHIISQEIFRIVKKRIHTFLRTEKWKN